MPKRKLVNAGSNSSKSAKLYELDKEAQNEVSALIESTFLLKCPPDFYEFYAFCCSVYPDSPLDALYKDLSVRLVGPFEVLHEPKKFKPNDDLTDCYRYFHDPPEVVTVLAEDGENSFHVGYFRDNYTDQPVFLVSSNPLKTGKFTILGGNMFATVLNLLKKQKTKGCSIPSTLSKLTKFIKDRRISVGSEMLVKREFTCETLNGVGIKIDMQNGVGYRPVPTTHGELITMLQILTDATNANTSKLDELMTLVQFANDEGDFGEGLELGLDLLAFHPVGTSASETFEKANRLNRRITCLLSTGYQLAGRPKFAQVVRRHMESRLGTRRLREVE
ncbi:unnamed protein product [Taenia asiatica]|uniref:UDENN domain-containing protein n=1 Tax=Taenia asiatica TaxID=60517 RepID=A0A0R3VX06_TAEAS|nr:unnamed protein product [Taenia asiatica]